MTFPENRFPSRIKSGTGIFGIMPYDPGIAPVAELVDAPDSKSGDGNIVLVRSRPGAPAFAASAASAGQPSVPPFMLATLSLPVRGDGATTLHQDFRFDFQPAGGAVLANAPPPPF